MFWKGKICPVCKQEFQENEDVVFCPDCGTAHHRACWQQNNSCFFNDEHLKGNNETTNEVVERREAQLYSDEHPNDNHIHPQGNQPELVICPVCGTYNKKEMRLCMNCGFEFGRAGFGPAAPGQEALPGGIDFSAEAEEGVTYQELARYCGFMAEDFLGKFEKVKKGGIVFNLSGFLLSFVWLLYRKMYGLGVIVGSICALPYFMYTILLAGGTAKQLVEITSSGTDTSAMLTQYNEAVSAYLSQHPELNLLIIITAVLLVLSMVFTGFMGYRFYYRKAVSDISRIKAMRFDTERTQLLIAMRGGANMLMPLLIAAIGYTALTLISLLVSTLVTM